MSLRPASPAHCPVCGAAVPAEAKSCRECGADERAGWNEEETRYDGLDLPGEAIEQGEDLEAQQRANRAAVLWRAVGFVLLVVIILLYIGL